MNLSPKGMDSFRVLGPTTVAYLDNVGSGNETAAHVLENGRITFMFCAFEGSPLILRLYGTGRSVLPVDAEWATLAARFPSRPGIRQIIVAELTRVQTSCGDAVPVLQLRRRTSAADRVGRREGSGGPGGLPAREERPQHRRPAHPADRTAPA